MIDVHCHLESNDYSIDRNEIITRCKKALDAVITCCAHPRDFELTMQLAGKHANFVYATASIHPEYISELADKEIEKYIELIRKSTDKIVAVGETGLDYKWVKDGKGRERQKALFIRFIELAKELQLPLVIHARNGQDEANAVEEAVDVLEAQGAKRVQMHMFTSRPLLKRVLANGWMVSVNTLILQSKSVKKIVRDCPLQQLMLETDAPWLGVKEGKIVEPKIKRNEPIAVKLVAEKIAEVKKVAVEDVDRQTTENAKRFFRIEA